MRVTGFSSSLVTTATLPFSSPDPFSGQRCGEMDGPSRWKFSGPPRSSWPRRFGTWIRPGIARKMGRCQRRMGSFVNSNFSNKTSSGRPPRKPSWSGRLWSPASLCVGSAAALCNSFPAFVVFLSSCTDWRVYHAIGIKLGASTCFRITSQPVCHGRTHPWSPTQRRSVRQWWMLKKYWGYWRVRVLILSIPLFITMGQWAIDRGAYAW